MAAQKQITRSNFGFLPGNRIGAVTLTRDATANARRPYCVEFTFSAIGESVSYHCKTAKHAARLFRGDYRMRHDFRATVSAEAI